MPLGYRFGFQQPEYQGRWKGLPEGRSWSAEHRALADVMELDEGTPVTMGDVTNLSQFFRVPDKDSPYYLHKREQRLPFFEVRKEGSPYWLHTHGLRHVDGFELSGRNLALAGAAAVVGWLLLRKK
ncbi:MAG: hypothetical protein R3322_00345 [Kiloniellales bacterium]|nr:hypothetical protein [Kiloniellales bacterium]